MFKKKLLLVFVIITVYLNNTYTQPKAYPIDSWHSKIGFISTCGGLIGIEGTFSDFKGTIMYDEKDLSILSATVFIETTSINTGVKLRDRHLRMEEFLHVEKFPYMVFRSTKVVERKGRQFLKGTMQLKGVTREVEIAFKRLHTLQADPWGNARVSFSGNFSINILDFGVGKEGDKWVGKNVEIEMIVSCRIFNMDKITSLNHPVAEEIYATMMEKDISENISFVKDMLQKHQQDEAVNRPEFLDYIGQKLMQYDRPKAAVHIFELNADLFPTRAGVQSQLANAYFLTGKKKLAVQFANKGLDLDAQNTLSIELLKMLKK